MQTDNWKLGYSHGNAGRAFNSCGDPDYQHGWQCGSDARESVERQKDYCIGTLTWDQVQRMQRGGKR